MIIGVNKAKPIDMYQVISLKCPHKGYHQKELITEKLVVQVSFPYLLPTPS